MITVRLNFNYGYKWFRRDGLSVKGYLFDENDRLFSGAELLEYFDSVSTLNNFRKKVQGANGLFSVILQKGDQLFAAVDRLRSFPVFYWQNGADLFISDEAEWLAARRDVSSPDKTRISEFLATGFVSGNHTLLNRIFQVRPGAIFHFDGVEARQEYYHVYFTSKINPAKYERQRRQLIEQIEQSFNRFIQSLQGRTAVVSLSGGYDSRLIAVMLKEAGYKNAVCFTFGRKDTPEADYAQKTAEILGFPWHFISHDSARISGFMQDPVFNKYYRFAANCASMFFMESYFALKYLKGNNIVPENAIFSAGHSGDFLGGSQLLKNGNIAEDAPLSEIARQIYAIKYALLKRSPEIKQFFLNEIETTLSEALPSGKQPFAYSLFENWDLKEKLARFIFNSSNVYDFFGYEYRHPFMDNGLFDFFKNVPYSFKLNKRLYDDVLVNHYFAKYHLNFKKELQPRPAAYKIQNIKNRLRPHLPGRMRQRLREKNDPNNYAEITRYFTNDLERRVIRVDKSGRNFNAIIVQWYVQQVREALIKQSQ